jgi:ABC-type xylose transport system permease subunit
MPDFEAIHVIIIGLIIGAVVSFILAVFKVPSWTDILIPTVQGIGQGAPNSPQVQSISDSLIIGIKFCGWFSAIDVPIGVIGAIFALYERSQ